MNDAYKSHEYKGQRTAGYRSSFATNGEALLLVRIVGASQGKGASGGADYLWRCFSLWHGISGRSRNMAYEDRSLLGE